MIYLARLGQSDYHRLGCAHSHQLQRALHAMRAELPEELTLVHSCAGGYAAAQVMFAELAPYAARGDWFTLPPELVPAVCAAMDLAQASPERPKRRRRTKAEMNTAKTAGTSNSTVLLLEHGGSHETGKR